MIISVINTKGGCEKSTIAGGLAGAYALRGKSVLLIDCDPQGTTTTTFNLGDGATIDQALAGVLLGNVSLNDVIVDTPIPGIRGIPSTKQMEKIGWMLEMNDEDHYFHTLAGHVAEVENSYDVIVIDSPNANSPILENVTYASDIFVVPYEGTQAVNRVVDFEDSLVKTRPEEDYLRIDILNNLSKPHSKLTRRATIERFDETKMSRPVFEVRTSAPMANIGDNGGSICHFDRHSLGAKDMFTLSHFLERKVGLFNAGEDLAFEFLTTDKEN